MFNSIQNPTESISFDFTTIACVNPRGSQIYTGKEYVILEINISLEFKWYFKNRSSWYRQKKALVLKLIM